MNQTQTAQMMQQINPAFLQNPAPCAQNQQQQQPKILQIEHPSGRIGLFHNSDGDSVKQVFKRRLRGRKAKIDSSTDTPVIDELEVEPKVE